MLVGSPDQAEDTSVKGLFITYLDGCAWEGSYDYFSMGSEINESLPIVVKNQTGEVFIKDPERETYEKIATGLDELILMMAKDIMKTRSVRTENCY